MKEAFFDRYRMYKVQSDILYKWMYSELDNRSLDNYLLNSGIKNIAIYGMTLMGELLYDKLKGSDINIDCFIDANRMVKSYYLEGTDVIKPFEVKDRKNIELIVISLPHRALEIEEDLKNFDVTVPIISVEDLIMGL